MTTDTGGGNAGLVASIAGVAIQIVPDIIALVKARHAETDPNAPTPSDADVLAGLKTAVESSIAKDDQWLAAHPEPLDPPF